MYMSVQEEIEIPRGSYELITDIIQGFLAAQGDKIAVSTKTIAEHIGRHPTQVGANIKAIIFLGIAYRDKGYTYILTKEGTDLAYALEYDDQEGVSSVYRSLISKNQFLRSLIFSVKNRGNISRYDLRDEIAKRARVTKDDSRATTGASTIIDMLLVSEYLKKEGDDLYPTNRTSELLKESAVEPPSKIETKPAKEVIEITTPRKTEIPMQIQIRLDFQVPLHPEEDDVKNIAETILRIRNYLLHESEDE